MTTEATVLLAWREANPRAPRDWLEIACRLASAHDEAWAPLRSHGDVALPVFSDACAAFRAAHVEVRRPSVKDERQKIERVKMLARRLKREIEESSLPADSAKLREISGPEGAIPAVIGWRDVPADGYGLGAALDICGILDLAIDMADGHMNNLPPRATERNRGRPLVSAFVRQMNVHLRNRYGGDMRSSLAPIANAVLALSDPIVRADVDDILKTAPNAFLPD